MDFKQHLKKYLDEKQIDSLCSTFEGKEHKGVYINTSKMSEEFFLSKYPHAKRHPIVKNAFLYDQDEYPLGKKVYHEFGAYYIQDPSAMLVAHYLNPEPNRLVLDMCAAPGGKTVMTSLLLNRTGHVLANDISRPRAMTLLSNIERMGCPNVSVLNIDFSNYYEFFPEQFDYIILDAPCSGSGMFRKMEEMKADWTYEKVLKNQAIQKELIKMAYYMLKPGGILMYSTCSYSFEEDEEVVEYLLKNSDAKLIPIGQDEEGIYHSPIYPETIHLFPHLFPGEGQYIAKIKKPGELEPARKSYESDYSRISTGPSGKKQIEKFIVSSPLLPKDLSNACIRYGYHKITECGDYFEPAHQWSHVIESNVPSIELTKEEVVKYMRGETILKEADELSDGFHFVSYKNMIIGNVKVIDGVLKNYYPKGLRINVDINNGF